MKFLYLIVFSLLTSLSTQAEDVIGKVLEKKNNKSVPLVGVNVYWARTTIGTITDTNGQFTINKINDSINNWFLAMLDIKTTPLPSVIPIR